MENRLIKVAKRLASLWKASRQLRVGLLLFLGVLLVAILAGVLSPITSATICWCRRAAKTTRWAPTIWGMTF